MKLEIGMEITEHSDGKVTSIKKVTRVTEKRAFVKISNTYEQVFKIESLSNGDLFLIGADRRSRQSYRITTDQDRRDLSLAVAVMNIAKTEWRKLPEETIFQILGIIKNVPKP